MTALFYPRRHGRFPRYPFTQETQGAVAMPTVTITLLVAVILVASAIANGVVLGWF